MPDEWQHKFANTIKPIWMWHPFYIQRLCYINHIAELIFHLRKFIKNDPVINDSPVVTDKPVLIKNENLLKNKNEKESQNRITEIRLPDTVSLLKNEMIVQTPLIDSLDQTAVVVPVKKKLKVVHINAIDEPSRQLQYIVKAPAKNMFRFDFGNQQVIESPRNIKNKNASLFEIKTSIN